MLRRSVLVLVCVPLVALAAPVPPEDDVAKLQRAYGTWNDPDKVCKYTLKGGQLRISLPAADRLFTGENKERLKAPRVLREVEGDFTATVRVTFPVPEPVKKGGWWYWSGGLVAWESEKGNLVLRRCAGQVNGSPEAILTQNTTTHHHLTIRGFAKPAEMAFLRIQRTGNKVTTGWSHDGTKWKSEEPIEVTWGAKVQVGVVAENCIGVPVEITFDQYSLTQPKK